MAVREVAGWTVALGLALAILVVWSGPWWSVVFVLLVAVLFVFVQALPAERRKMSRSEVADQALGSTAVWLRLVLPLAGFAVAAVQGDGELVVFFVLATASLVLGLVWFQVFGI